MTYSWYKLSFNITEVESSETLVFLIAKTIFYLPEYLAMLPFFFLPKTPKLLEMVSK